MLNQILDLLFPKSCVSCGKGGTFLCLACRQKMLSLATSICPMCERSCIDSKTHPGCLTRYSLDGLTSFYRYEGSTKAAIKRLKYKPYLGELSSILIHSIVESIEGQKKQFNNFVVVPVPLHPQRERERGFNQAGLIGQALSKRLVLPFVPDMLKRTKYTKPQVSLKGNERRKNLTGAFILNSTYHIPHTILLVDDVWTTGSTMRACANVLKRGGAKKVWALTIAR